jgi:hypothetical protein
MMTREQCPTHAKPNRRRDRAADAWGRPEAGGGAAGGIAAPNAQVRHSGASAWHNWSNPGPATLAELVGVPNASASTGRDASMASTVIGAGAIKRP